MMGCCSLRRELGLWLAVLLVLLGLDGIVGAGSVGIGLQGLLHHIRYNAIVKIIITFWAPPRPANPESRRIPS